MDDIVYPNETAPFFHITAIGIHINSGNKPPTGSKPSIPSSYLPMRWMSVKLQHGVLALMV